MFTSTIIPTIGRESLTRAVESVLNQKFDKDAFEVIVVNDTGAKLPHRPWHDSSRVRILDTNKCERCFARNAGAAIAKGRYLHFLDDDDWLLPGALEAWWVPTQDKTIAWIYGGTHFIDENGQLIAKHKLQYGGNCFSQITSGEWIQLGASLIKSSAFFEIGGFDPDYLMAEDKDLCRRIALYWDFAFTASDIVCFLRDRTTTSTEYEFASYHEIKSRNTVLSQKEAFTRMHSSITDAYWAGKLPRAYLTCVWWNLKKRRLGQAFGKAIRAFYGFVLTSKHITDKKYWNALTKPHINRNIY